jgi:hypothetical protein
MDYINNSKDRNKLYRLALLKLLRDQVRDKQDIWGHAGYPLCIYLKHASRLLPGWLTTVRDLPEFMLFEPLFYEDGEYWWRRGDDNARINCLLFCIEMTN